VGNVGQKFFTLVELVLTSGGGNGLQMTLLLAVICMSIGRMEDSSVAAQRALQIAAALAFTSCLPTPTYVQYFCLCIPFLIVAAVCSASAFLDSLKPERTRRLAATAATALVALFAVASAKDYARFVETGESVNGIWSRDRASDWKLDTVKSVSRAIDELVAPGERIMSFWPGYYLEAKAEPWPGFESDTGRDHADVLSPAELSHNHILSGREIARALASHNPRLVVLGNQETMRLRIEPEPYEEMLVRSGYVAVRRIGHTTLWVTH